VLKQFSLERQKKYTFPNWFYSLALSDWLKKLMPLCHLIRRKSKTNHDSDRLYTFSRTPCRLLGFASSFDWFIGLSVSFVIDQTDHFGFGFTTLN